MDKIASWEEVDKCPVVKEELPQQVGIESRMLQHGAVAVADGDIAISLSLVEVLHSLHDY